MFVSCLCFFSAHTAAWAAEMRKGHSLSHAVRAVATSAETAAKVVAEKAASHGLTAAQVAKVAHSAAKLAGGSASTAAVAAGNAAAATNLFNGGDEKTASIVAMAQTKNNGGSYDDQQVLLLKAVITHILIQCLDSSMQQSSLQHTQQLF